MMTKNQYLTILFILSALYAFVGYLMFPEPPYTPSMGALVFWGFIGPVIAMALTWLFSKKIIPTKSSWLRVSILFSVFFVITGCIATISIVAVWYTI